jgi:hypothetical protein
MPAEATNNLMRRSQRLMLQLLQELLAWHERDTAARTFTIAHARADIAAARGFLNLLADQIQAAPYLFQHLMAISLTTLLDVRDREAALAAQESALLEEQYDAQGRALLLRQTFCSVLLTVSSLSSRSTILDALHAAGVSCCVGSHSLQQMSVDGVHINHALRHDV